MQLSCVQKPVSVCAYWNTKIRFKNRNIPYFNKVNVVDILTKDVLLTQQIPFRECGEGPGEKGGRAKKKTFVRGGGVWVCVYVCVSISAECYHGFV